MNSLRKISARSALGRAVRRCPAGLALLALLVLAAGCGRKHVPAPPISAEQVPQTLENAFQEANPEVSNTVSEVVTAVRQDDPQALEGLQELATKPDLSVQQREAATRALQALLEKLRAEEAKGNKKAAQAMEQYRISK